MENEDKIVLYTTDSGKVTVSVRFEEDNFWMTQKAIEDLFETTTANVNIHIKNILDDEELDSNSTIKEFLIVQTEGDEIPMSMADWFWETDNFLQNNRRKVLEGKGKISHEAAIKKAEEIYEQFRVRQDKDYVSQFDIEMSKYLKGKANKDE
ncbi:RhuM family protein [Desulfitobacterium chlororespirans]|uniref:Virulence protein RhuM family protein n=1 Tax=Desulfitobacterium chlororespirans DSM 11544 TaxID=1121395 RepID=A0A1M7TIF3_9FIRM|nr:RhuM family protein [Desulfitobacterium chlororespirans]SHN70505.1 Virulence protein RhuM family protein [Desulfitobacterium chlororespirans DSM 11544]